MYYTGLQNKSKEKKWRHDKSVSFFMGIINDVLLGNLRMWWVLGFLGNDFIDLEPLIII